MENIEYDEESDHCNDLSVYDEEIDLEGPAPEASYDGEVETELGNHTVGDLTDRL